MVVKLRLILYVGARSRGTITRSLIFLFEEANAKSVCETSQKKAPHIVSQASRYMRGDIPRIYDLHNLVMRRSYTDRQRSARVEILPA